MNLERDRVSFRLCEAEAMVGRYREKWAEAQSINDGLRRHCQSLEDDKQALQDRVTALELGAWQVETSDKAILCELGGSLRNKATPVQTDLSYQYLESRPPETVLRHARVR